MDNYFIIHHKQQIGPLSSEELKKLKINKNTLVWREGMADWLPAKDFPEVWALVRPQPPRVPVQRVPTSTAHLDYNQVEDIAGVESRYALFACGAVLVMGIFLSDFVGSNLGIFVFSGLSIGSWYFFKRYFDALGDESTGRFIYWIIGAQAIYTFTCWWLDDVYWLQDAEASAYEVMGCILIAGWDECFVRDSHYAQRMMLNFNIGYYGLLFSIIGVWIAGIRVLYINRQYQVPLKRIALSAMIFIPLWMAVQLMDRVTGFHSLGIISGFFLMLPYLFLFLHFYRAETEDATA